MNTLNRIRLMMWRRFRENLDLLFVWLVLVVVQPMIPVGHLLSRDDLAPWLMLTLSAAAFLRGRRLGKGPHPMLTRRQTRTGGLIHRLVMVVFPWALLLWYDGMGQGEPAMLGAAGGIVVVLIILKSLARSHGRTAWNPPGISGFVVWGSQAVALAAVIGAAGWLCGPAGAPLRGGLTVPSWLGVSTLVGFGFLGIGMVSGSAMHLRQRRAAGMRDGSPHRIAIAPALLAVAGTGVGLALLFLFFPSTQEFQMGFVGALHVVVWASVLWPRREPLARACMLHEVVPTGGGDKETGDTALSFERPPEGALRFNPLRTKRIRVMHPWIVPIRGARIGQLDDPVHPLWDPPAPFQSNHVLGTAAFEPDAITRQTQWDVIQLTMSRRQDVGTVETGAGHTRRIVILRAFPSPESRGQRRLATYRWESRGAEDSIQVLDASARTATLRDGDLLILSSEGVARAFEVELGSPLYSWADAEAFRPPQLEDYVEAGA